MKNYVHHRVASVHDDDGVTAAVADAGAVVVADVLAAMVAASRPSFFNMQGFNNWSICRFVVTTIALVIKNQVE